MQVELSTWQKKWDKDATLHDAELVIYFGGKTILTTATHYQELKQRYPKAQILGCSTGGEIYGADVLDGSLIATAVKLAKTDIATATLRIKDSSESLDAGKQIATLLNKPGLRHIFVLSDGTNVNGSELVKGIYSVVDPSVTVTGGLAGDGAAFKETLVGLNDAPAPRNIGAIGFYGSALRIGYGSVGGWDPFGPERKITRSSGNVLYELDGKPALDLYKEYLGEEADKLPGSALLFPLSIRPDPESEHQMVRTIVGVDNDKKSMIFAGDMPEGYIAQLMRGNFDNLIEGAANAAGLAVGKGPYPSSLAILVSCIGRKLLLGQAISDETEAVAEVFNHEIPTVGFYSYGEICHQQFTGKCGLHNQTMTVTLLHEDE